MPRKRAATPAPADPVEVMVDQFAYLVWRFRQGGITAAELDRFKRVHDALLEPFGEQKFPIEIWRPKNVA
jgi:hypothetical protein